HAFWRRRVPHRLGRAGGRGRAEGGRGMIDGRWSMVKSFDRASDHRPSDHRPFHALPLHFEVDPNSVAGAICPEDSGWLASTGRWARSGGSPGPAWAAAASAAGSEGWSEPCWISRAPKIFSKLGNPYLRTIGPLMTALLLHGTEAGRALVSGSGAPRSII